LVLLEELVAVRRRQRRRPDAPAVEPEQTRGVERHDGGSARRAAQHVGAGDRRAAAPAAGTGGGRTLEHAGGRRSDGAPSAAVAAAGAAAAAIGTAGLADAEEHAAAGQDQSGGRGQRESDTHPAMINVSRWSVSSKPWPRSSAATARIRASSMAASR